MSTEPISAPENTPLRTELAAIAYHTLLQACQADVALWTAFVSHEGNTELHMRLFLDDDVSFSGRLARLVKNLCQDTSFAQDVPNFYWRHILPGLKEALGKSIVSEPYFDLAVDILHHDQVTQGDETGLRDFIQTLIALLWWYQHTETPPLLIADKGMAGLLRMLLAATTILKSHKHPLELEGFPTRLFRQLLFPSLNSPEYRALGHEETRAHVYDLIQTTLAPENDYEDLINSTCGALYSSANAGVDVTNARFPGNSEWLRPPSDSAGLSNLGMTCYMNSLLQQLYANLQFRKFILEQPVLDAQKQEILLKVQGLFARMQNSTELVANTSSLAGSLNVQVGVQEDVHTFYTALLSRLEERMPDHSQRLALTRFFTGKSVTQIKGQCGHVSSRVEPFTELSITVKNKASLRDSLDEFVQGEPLEGANRYMCMTCGFGGEGQLVNAMKRTCLDEVPDCLTFCLKRFAFENILDGENKVNDRFDFPPEIDMSLYKRRHLESADESREQDVFELVGVIVHQGSLSYGHYWSYARVPGLACTDPRAWLYLEDTKTTRCANGITEVQQQCFGGLTWSDGSERPESAYVLFYQRKDYIRQASIVNAVPKHLQASHLVLPTVSDLPGPVSEEIEVYNDWRLRIAALFDDRFSSFVFWLLGLFPSSTATRGSSPDSSEAMNQTDSTAVLTESGLQSKIGDLISSYVLHVLVADPTGESKLTPLLSRVAAILDARPSTASHILTKFCEDSRGFTAIVNNRSSKVRFKLFDLIETCVLSVKEHQPEDYDRLAAMVIATHSSLLRQALDSAGGRWAEYFCFAARFARMGLFETWLILDSGYLLWICEVLSMRSDVELRKKHQPLWTFWKTNTLDLSPLFDFLHDLLSGHVELNPEVDRVQPEGDDRVQAKSGWVLRDNELANLFLERSLERPRCQVWLLFQTGARWCSVRCKWNDYALGKLVGLLSGERAHPMISQFVERHLATCFELEESTIEAILYPALHFCLTRNDQSCGNLMKVLSKNLVEWEGRERRSLWFFREAYPFAPISIVDTVPTWAKEFLLAKNSQSRQAVSLWLQDHIFGPPTLSEWPELDASRIRSTRGLVKQCHSTLKRAYDLEEHRNRYEAMIDAMEHAKTYLVDLQVEVTQRRPQQQRVTNEENEGETEVAPATAIDISPGVQIECDESRSLLAGLVQLLRELRDWESAETALPTRTLNIRRSVEFEGDADGDDDELAESEVDFEDGDSELTG